MPAWGGRHTAADGDAAWQSADAAARAAGITRRRTEQHTDMKTEDEPCADFAEARRGKKVMGGIKPHPAVGPQGADEKCASVMKRGGHPNQSPSGRSWNVEQFEFSMEDLVQGAHRPPHGSPFLPILLPKHGKDIPRFPTGFRHNGIVIWTCRAPRRALRRARCRALHRSFLRAHAGLFHSFLRRRSRRSLRCGAFSRILNL